MKHAKKLTLFQRGAAAGQRYSVSYEHYLCPICKNSYNQLALSAGELTIEHVPPAAVGGKPIALTCRACNTTCGHSIDAAVGHRDHVLRLTKTIARKAFGQGGRAVLRIGGQPLNVDVTGDANGIVSFNILERSNDSRALNA